MYVIEFCENISFTSSGSCDLVVEAWWLFTKNVKHKVSFAILGERFWSIKKRLKKNIVAMLPFISFFLAIQFLVQVATNFEL